MPTLNSTNSKGILWKIGRNQDWYYYQNELSNEFSEWNAESFHDANSLWTSWKSKLINAATNTIGVKKGNSNKKNFAYDEDVKLAINERKAANKNHHVWLKSKNRDESQGNRLWEIYKDKKQSAKKLVRQKAMQKRFNDSIEISKKCGPGCRDFWKNLRGNKNCKNDLNCLRIPNTNDITYDKKVMNQSIMHYFQTLGKMNLNLNLKDDRVYNMDETYCFKTKDELYNASYQKDNLDVQVNDFEFSLDEVKDAITKCKNNKSQGLDGITNELLKNGGDSVHLSLYAMFVKLREFECVPDDWNKGIIIPIHKKGTKCDLNNYRGITLNSCVSKIYNRLITKSNLSFLEAYNLLSEI